MVSGLPSLPPGTCTPFTNIAHWGSAFPLFSFFHARRFSFNFAHSRSRAFLSLYTVESFFSARKKVPSPHEHDYSLGRVQTRITDLSRDEIRLLLLHHRGRLLLSAVIWLVWLVAVAVCLSGLVFRAYRLVSSLCMTPKKAWGRVRVNINIYLVLHIIYLVLL